MKNGAWGIPKEAFENALDLILTVPTRQGIISSEFIRLEPHKEKGAKMSLSSEMSGHAFFTSGEKCPLKHPVYLDRRMLQPFVMEGKDLPAEVYELQLKDEKHVVMKHASRKGMFRSNKKAEGYEKPPEMETKPLPLSEKISKLLGCAKLFATDDPVTPNMNCAWMEPDDGDVRVISTNTHIVFSGSVSAKASLPKKPIAFPLLLIDALKAETGCSLLYSDKAAMLQFSCGRIWQPVKHEARKKFPRDSLLKLIEQGRQGKHLLSMNAQSLAVVSGRIAAYMSSVTREDLVLKMKADTGKSYLHLMSGTHGSDFNETIKLPFPAKADVSIRWPLDAVIGFLDYCKGFGEARILLNEKTNQTCFVSGKVTVVIAPERKKEKR